ncbi:MAG: efflux RND transporter permease subunit [Rhodopseudomonas palustris]|nr:efflux RND transporter permease subunit [Rhodopseudomonas palustris]
MKPFNLSEWAINQPRRSSSILMIVAVVGRRRCRSCSSAAPRTRRSPSAPWSSAPPGPGRRVDDTLEQVTERLERTLQETDHLDRVRSYTVAGQTTIFVDLKQSTPPDDGAGRLVPGAQERRRHAPHAAAGRGRARSSTTTSATPSASSTRFTADGFSFRELRDYVEAARSRLLQVPDVSKIEVLGAQDEQIFIEFSTERLAGLRPRTCGADRRRRCRRRTWCARPASIQTEQERVFLRVSGAFDDRARHRGGQLRRRRPHLPARRHRHGAPRLRRSAAADVPRQRQAGASASRSRCATPATSWPWARTSKRRWPTIVADLPVGIEPMLVADQAGDGRRGHQRLHDLALAGDRRSSWRAASSASACGPARWWRWRSR